MREKELEKNKKTEYSAAGCAVDLGWMAGSREGSKKGIGIISIKSTKKKEWFARTTTTTTTTTTVNQHYQLWTSFPSVLGYWWTRRDQMSEIGRVWSIWEVVRKSDRWCDGVTYRDGTRSFPGSLYGPGTGVDIYSGRELNWLVQNSMLMWSDR